MCLSLVLALPLSTFAESFTVTTNKDIYTPEEKAIIVGAISEGAPDGYSVQIKVTGQSGDCTSQHLLPAADNSFISRPIRLDECGVGEFTVSASYADESATSTFVISNSSRADEGSKLELRTLRNVIGQAQDVVNGRVKELIEDDFVLTEEIARLYGEGVSEASLAHQAIEFGDAAVAKKHMIFALRDFRDVLNLLSEESLTRFEQTAEQKAAKSDNFNVVGTYSMLQRYYYRLVELAEKNQVDRGKEFEAAAELLSHSRQMIDEGHFETAALRLDQVIVLLEEIRADLVGEGEENLAYSANNSSRGDGDSGRRLVEAADRFERTALQLLNKTSSTEAQAKLQDALSLIVNARASIEAGQFDSARAGLSLAYQTIQAVEDFGDEDNDSSDSGGGKNNNSEHSENDDRDEMDDDNDSKNSKSGSDDDQ